MTHSAEIVAMRSVDSGRFSSIRPIVLDSLGSTSTFSRPIHLIGKVQPQQGTTIEITIPSGGTAQLEIVANRVASQLDPVINILDSNGRQIVGCDDDPFAARDCRAVINSKLTPSSFRAAHEENYRVTVRDVSNGGGDDYFFYVRGAIVGPQAGDVRFPPALSWVAAPRPSAVRIDQTENGHEEIQQLKVPTFRVAEFSRTTKHHNPNHVYSFQANAGQRLIISTESRKYGSPCDPAITLFDSDGKRIAESVGAGAEGASITNRFEKAGTYRVEVREISKLAGPRLDYWLKIEEAKPGVVLTTEVERAEFSKDGEAKIKIDCKRYDYDGPVTLRIDGLPQGVSIVDPVIPEKKNDFELKLKKTGAVDAFNMRIKGALQSKDSASVADTFPVSTMPALRKLFPLQMFPCAAMDGWIAVNPPND